LGLDFNEKPVQVNDMDDPPTPIIKLPQTPQYAQVISIFLAEYSSEMSILDVMNVQSFRG
jgi:hypothetical protein